MLLDFSRRIQILMIPQARFAENIGNRCSAGPSRRTITNTSPSLSLSHMMHPKGRLHRNIGNLAEKPQVIVHQAQQDISSGPHGGG